MPCGCIEQQDHLVSFHVSRLKSKMLICRDSAVVMRLVLAFKIQEGDARKGARKANTDILDFSNEYKSLVAIPRRFDCCFVARDDKWVESKL